MTAKKLWWCDYHKSVGRLGYRTNLEGFKSCEKNYIAMLEGSLDSERCQMVVCYVVSADEAERHDDVVVQFVVDGNVIYDRVRGYYLMAKIDV
jgi:hypothetical protein